MVQRRSSGLCFENRAGIVWLPFLGIAGARHIFAEDGGSLVRFKLNGVMLIELSIWELKEHVNGSKNVF